MLVSPNEKEYDDLVAIVKGRIEEGNGETIFDIGDTSEGMHINISFQYLKTISSLSLIIAYKMI